MYHELSHDRSQTDHYDTLSHIQYRASYQQDRRGWTMEDKIRRTLTLMKDRKGYKALQRCSENLSNPRLKVIPEMYFVLAKGPVHLTTVFLVYSRGYYLEPTLTTLTTLDLYAHSTRFSPTLTSTLPILYLLLQTSPILVDHLGNFDWSFGALDGMWNRSYHTVNKRNNVRRKSSSSYPNYIGH